MIDGLEWLKLVLEPMSEPRRLPSGDWRQDAAYPEPLWTNTAAELARRVSIENLGGFYALQLLGHLNTEPRAAEIFAAARWATTTRYHASLADASRPIEEGFLRRLRFWRDAQAPEQPAALPAVWNAFTRSEAERLGDIEPWLRAHYGQRPESELFDWIDYPGFDCGTMTLGFAIFVHGGELHIWSRAAHAHK